METDSTTPDCLIFTPRTWSSALAERIQPKLLALTHIVRMKATDGELLDGVRRGGYRGRVVVGHDLERY